MEEGNQSREFTPEMKLFVVLEKEKGTTYPRLVEMFGQKLPDKKPPSRVGVYKMRKGLQTNQTLLDRRTTNSGGGKSIRTEENIQMVKDYLEAEVERNPDEIGSSARRNDLPFTNSSFNRITKKDLKLHPYKIIRQQKVSAEHAFLRLQMGRILSRKPRSWFSNLCVSDEAWFSLGGHVFNRKNTVLYAPGGNGTPEQWFSEASQAQKKVMVFCVLHGSGKKFGPYFHEEDENINQWNYRELLHRKVFPQMKRTLGQDLFSLTIWQQDGAKPHQANMVMEWLDGIFEERMLAIRARRGDSWAPSSPDMNPCDSFLWGYLKEVVYKPLPASLEELKATIKREFRAIPEVMVKKAVYGMKKRAAKMVEVEGRAFEGKSIRL